MTVRRRCAWIASAFLFASLQAGCGRSASSDVRPALAALTVTAASGSQLAVLLPDGFDPTDPRAKAWADAAQEQGIQLTFVYDSDFLSYGTTARGLVLPDQIHPRASATLIAALQAYANAGGGLLLDYDFGSLDENGFYPLTDPSRLSALAGIGYVYYATLGGTTIGLGPISGMSSTLRTLQVPPGKSMPPSSLTTATTNGTAAPAAAVTGASSGPYLPTSPADPSGLSGYNHVLQFTPSPTIDSVASPLTVEGAQASKLPPPAPPPDTTEVISGYVYGPLQYPSFVTGDASTYDGTVLLTSGYGLGSTGAMVDGVAAGVRSQGQGQVLFVNLPLVYLKGQTDAMLINGFLQYFAVVMLKQPRLSESPSGRGGLVFNWHVDAEEAIPAIQQLDNSGVWNHGPFSIHFTAGPDVEHVGDGLGMNLPGNATAQQWLKTFLKKGHRVGSHGGWDHDLYGLHVPDYDPVPAYADMNYTDVDPATGAVNVVNWYDFLVWNQQAIEAVGGAPVVEYSAPEGNNPHWALDWAAEVGVVGYYFTGDTGASPTRAYRPPYTDTSGFPGDMLNPSMWAYPVSPFGKYAVFEEFEDFHVSPTDVSSWYSQLLNFVVANRTTRMIYAHPPGAALNTTWTNVLLNFLKQAKTLQGQGQFSWYTMTDLSQFETQRLGVQWVEGSGGATKRVFQASHPTSLAGYTWLLPRSVYLAPVVNSGSAKVSSDGNYWIVVAGNGSSLQFTSMRQ